MEAPSSEKKHSEDDNDDGQKEKRRKTSENQHVPTAGSLNSEDGRLFEEIYHSQYAAADPSASSSSKKKRKSPEETGSTGDNQKWTDYYEKSQTSHTQLHTPACVSHPSSPSYM